MRNKQYLLYVCFLSVLFSQSTVQAQAQVTYLERSWDSASKQVKTETKSRTDCKEITGKKGEDWEGLGNGWYVMKGEVRRKVVHVIGDAHLILADGCQLSALQLKIEAQRNAKLHVYSQSDGNNQGKIAIYNNYFDLNAAIGSSGSNSMGSLYIHGGDISASHGPHRNTSAAIGGGAVGQIDPKSEVVIYAGKVTATGTSLGAAIGGGEKASQGGPITIYGGTVDARGGSGSAAIGGGWRGNGGTVNIYGGKVTARAIPNEGKCTGAGIGGGDDGQGGDVHIYGGEVTAYGGMTAAGIGGSGNGSGGTLEVTGGLVYASGYDKSSQAAPGIGGGLYGGDGGKVTITGGIVKAVTKHSNQFSAAPIGASTYEGGHLFYNTGEVLLGDAMKVAWSNHNDAISDAQYQQGSYLHAASGAKRAEACMERTYTFVQIEPCNHAEWTYVVKDDSKHWHQCIYCNHKIEESHVYEGGKCVCGKAEVAESDWWTITIQKTNDGKNYTSDDYLVIKGMVTTLPAPPAVEGLTFMGYLPTTTAPSGIEMKDSEREQLVQAGTDLTPTTNATYYARYRYSYKEDWQWSDDFSEASVTLTNPLISEPVTIKGTATEDLKARYEPTEESLGEAHYYAIATYNKAPDITYQFEGWEMTILYQPRIVVLDALDTAEENIKTLDKYYGFKADVTINNLTLVKDGKLHPISLPFDVTLSGSPLEGATLYKFSQAHLSGHLLKVEFAHATSIESGMPYFYCFNDKGTDVQHPTFRMVLIGDVVGGLSYDENVYLQATFQPLTIEGAEGLEPVVFDGNEFIPANNAVKGFGNYFLVPTQIQDDGSQTVRNISLVFEQHPNWMFDKKIAYSWDGAGTEATPYIISNTDQFIELCEAFTASDAAKQKGKYFRQTADILFDKNVENNYKPITSFTSHYDGAGHTISGLNIHVTGTQRAGLFATLDEGATVKHVVVQNSTFKGYTAAPIAAAVLGGARVDSCHVLKDVTVESETEAGGIVAVMNNGASAVSACTSHASVKGYSGVGGIVGMLTNGTVSNSIYLGSSLTANAATNAVLGARQSGKVENCYFTAPTLKDDLAKLMPAVSEDNTNFLNHLHERDQYLLQKGLIEDQIGYDLTLNGREYKATQQADGTWKRWVYSICLPFDMDLAKLENANDIKVYKLHEVDVDNKVFLFTNEFPILKAGELYMVVVEKGALTIKGTNIMAAATPKEPLAVNNADASKQVGWWCGTFKRLENEQLVEGKAYLIQKNGTFRLIEKIYASRPYINPFLGYFSAMDSSLGSVYQVKFIPTENGVETGNVTDFPADEFDCDFDLDDETGVNEVRGRKEEVRGDFYNLAGQRVAQPTKGLFIQNGKKIVIK